jgi:hypothetical protein
MRNRLSPSLILAVIAIVLATTAGATAATNLITGKQIKNDSITGADIKSHSIAGTDLKDSAVSATNLTPNLLATVKSKAPGPAGPAGAPGPAGPTGPAGANASVSVVTVTSPTQTVASGGVSNDLRAFCPPGMTVVGTGFDTGIGNADFVLSYGTFVGAFMDNDVGIPVEMSVQAICAAGAANAGAQAASVRSSAGARFERDEAAARSEVEHRPRSSR